MKISVSHAKTIILRAPGANCDGEAHFAFELAGVKVRAHYQSAARAFGAAVDSEAK